MNQSPTTVPDDVHCVGCGYWLQGVARNGACPECGRSVDDSIRAAGTTTKRDIVVIVARIFALWVWVKALIYLIQTGFVWWRFSAIGSGGRSQATWEIMLGMALEPILFALFGSILWFTSPRISRKVIPIDATFGEHLKFSARQMFCVLASTVGLLVVVAGLRDAVLLLLPSDPGYVHYVPYFRYSGSTMSAWVWTVPITKLAVGGGLLVWPDRLARRLRWWRAVGQER